MKEILLARTGGRPVKFTGEAIAQVDGLVHSGREQNRYHSVAVYKTAGGKYVLQIVYRSTWEGEGVHHHVTVHDTIEGVVDEIALYSPLEHFVGYPPHPQFAKKQARLEESLSLRWGALISDLLAQIPEAAEEIE
jgi:hypothetical protein